MSFKKGQIIWAASPVEEETIELAKEFLAKKQLGKQDAQMVKRGEAVIILLKKEGYNG